MNLRNLRTKYTGTNIAIRAALWFTLCNFLQKGIVMITLPIFTRLLSMEQYGVFSVYQSWYSIIYIIATLNLSGGVFNNGMVKYENRRNEFISSLQGLSTCCTLSLFVVYLVAMPFWNNLLDLSSIFIFTMFIQLLFEPAYQLWAQRQRYEYKYIGLVIVTLSISLLSPVLGVFAVLSTTYKAAARVVSFALVQICFGLVIYIIQLSRGKKAFVPEFWKYALLFNLPLVPHYLSQVVLGQADRIMISRMVGNDEAALYSVAYNLSSAIAFLIGAINSSYIPTLFRKLKEKRYTDIAPITVMLCVIIAGAVSVIILAGPDILYLFTTSHYMDAVWIMPPIASSVYFTFVYVLFINIEFFFEKTKYVMRVSLAGAITNILLNYIFIPLYGYIAAGYTTVICYILFAVGHYVLYKLILRRNNIKEDVFGVRKMAVISFFMIGVMLAASLLYRNSIVRYATLACCAVVFILKRKVILSYIKRSFKKEA